ncbi:MAG TPA: erythromycin esterase family protein [Pyrinomonadaceae bacterium]|nr:erythromycin esterase family protein [Pyrinomonadaceae bacterium]
MPEPGKPVEREMQAGETHVYQITLKNGEFLDAAVNQRGIDVVVQVFAPDNSKVAEIDSPNGDQGDEPIRLEAKTAGVYRIEVSRFGQAKTAKSGRYEIRVNELLSPKANAKRLAELKRKQQAVISWLKNDLIPIKTVEAGNGFADLQPLKQVFRDVRFVGLGEQTHGTREFFRFKHRMLEFLVKEMGFRVFAIEASYSACENINDYVMGRSDDGAKALDSQGFWTWNTEEVRAMIDWMREYNKSVPANKKVKFVGFDIQINKTGKTKLLEYLKRVAPERTADAETLFKISEEETAEAIFEQKDKDAPAKFNDLKNKYNELLVFLDLNGANLVAKSSQAEYERMFELARVIAQYLDSYSYTDWRKGVATRDLYMADNLRRIVNRETANTRFVVWAHNGHIQTGESDGYQPLGSHLRRLYGKSYYALGFSFNQGAFQAREQEPQDAGKVMLKSWSVGPAIPDSIEWYEAQTGVKSFIIDFRAVRQTAEITEWLSTPRQFRSVGSGYTPSFEATPYPLKTLNKEFDGLFFIDTTTRARPNPSVKNVAP